jgi:hypothetical protein
MQRIPLELGLQLNLNRLISDGLVQPGKVTQLSDFYWLDDEGGETLRQACHSLHLLSR